MHLAACFNRKEVTQTISSSRPGFMIFTSFVFILSEVPQLRGESEISAPSDHRECLWLKLQCVSWVSKDFATCAAETAQTEPDAVCSKKYMSEQQELKILHLLLAGINVVVINSIFKWCGYYFITVWWKKRIAMFFKNLDSLIFTRYGGFCSESFKHSSQNETTVNYETKCASWLVFSFSFQCQCIKRCICDLEKHQTCGLTDNWWTVWSLTVTCVDIK